jgi:thiol-disulfide isomerase/thioredoxin
MKLSLLTFSILFVFTGQLFAQKEYLSGSVTEAQIRDIEIFDTYTKRYKVDENAIEKLNTVQDSIFIDVFMGTWCHDSKREVPALFKIMESISNPLITAKYTALEYRRSGPKDIIEKNDIKRTPTFIVYKNGVEIGRIIEEVDKSVESDLLKIILEQE